MASATGRPVRVVLAGTVGAGSATPNATVTGLATTDTILSVVQHVKGENSLPLLGYGTVSADTLPLTYSADPGANGTITVAVERAATVDSYTPVSYGAPTADTLTVTYGANPGAGAKVEVTVYRPSAVTPIAGEYAYTVTTHLPSFTFVSGSAPTTQKLRLEWTLPDGVEPVVLDLGTAF